MSRSSFCIFSISSCCIFSVRKQVSELHGSDGRSHKFQLTIYNISRILLHISRELNSFTADPLQGLLVRVSNFELDGIEIPLVLRVLLPEVLGDAVSLILQPYVGQMTILAGDPGVTSESTFASISALTTRNLTAPCVVRSAPEM